MILVIRTCSECPMMRTDNGANVCAVATPKNRPIPGDTDRPSWCPLRREKVIVQQPNN